MKHRTHPPDTRLSGEATRHPPDAPDRKGHNCSSEALDTPPEAADAAATGPHRQEKNKMTASQHDHIEQLLPAPEGMWCTSYHEGETTSRLLRSPDLWPSDQAIVAAQYAPVVCITLITDGEGQQRIPHTKADLMVHWRNPDEWPLADLVPSAFTITDSEQDARDEAVRAVREMLARAESDRDADPHHPLRGRTLSIAEHHRCGCVYLRASAPTLAAVQS